MHIYYVSFLGDTRVIAEGNQNDGLAELTSNPLALYHTKKRMMEEWSSILEKVEESELITKFSSKYEFTIRGNNKFSSYNIMSPT